MNLEFYVETYLYVTPFEFVNVLTVVNGTIIRGATYSGSNSSRFTG